ncbi:MAG: hypothetical protein AAFO03_17050 [Bacteroidota bacterium]
MKNTLLSTLIASLSLRERQEARKWLQSPLHNERKSSLRLFNHLEEFHFELGLPPERERAFRTLFPEQEYDDQVLRLECSYLLQNLEQWLRWRSWSKAPQDQSLLLSAYRNLGLPKHFHRAAQKAQRLQERSLRRDHRFHYQQYLIEEELYLFQSRAGRGRPLNLQQQEDALQKAILSYKLRLACLSLAHQRVSGAQYEIAMLPEVLQLATTSTYADEPAIAVYYHAYLMYQDVDNEAAFRQFEQLLFTHLPKFPDQEGRDLVLLGINFCIRQINKKGEAYFAEALSLYRQGLDQDLLREDGFLSAFTFSNIVIIAIRSGELDWVQGFIEQYRRQLEPTRRQAIYALNAARIAYQQGQHRDAMLLLHQFSDRDFIHTLSAKIIQLKIFYEGGDFQLLAAHIKNTRAYLRRVKTDSYHKKIYVNIFSLTDQLMKLPPYDQEKRVALRQQIIDTEPLTEKEWLLAQL